MSTKKRTYTAAQKKAYAAKRNRAIVVSTPVYRGHGDYKLYKAPRAIRASKQTTRSVGGSIGAHLGNGIHNIIKSLTGFGDYQVAENSLMGSSILGGDPPIIQNSNNNSHVVHHREYIGDVFAANAFTVQTYPINPGLLQSFPWVAQQADSYEQYKFRGMVYEFKSMSSDAVLSTASSSALGTVIMSTQYNALEVPFSDKRTMENYEYANSCKPSVSMLHPIECKISQNTLSELYVRIGSVSQGDIRFYDLGNFSIAVQGMQNAGANQVIGELWVSYEVEFFKPKLLAGGGALLTDHYFGAGTNVFTPALPYGPSGTLVLRSQSNLGCKLQVAAVAPYAINSIVFPSWVTDGMYMITYTQSGFTAVTTNSPSYNAGTTVNIDVLSTQVKLLSNNFASSSISPSVGQTTTSVTVIQLVNIIQTTPGIPAGIQLLFPAGAFPSAGQTVDLFITQIAATIN